MLALAILHVWDVAGVGSILCKWQRRAGHRSNVLMRSTHDPFGISRYYGSTLVRDGKSLFIKAHLMATRADVLHLHDMVLLLPWWRRLHVGKRMVLHEHGSRTRDTPPHIRAPLERYVDHILVAMPEMLGYGHTKQPTYLPIPIDTELFMPRDIPQNNKGLVLMQRSQTEQETLSLLEENGYADVDWDCVVRGNKLVYNGRQNSLYQDMPEMLSQYQYYADVRVINGVLLRDYSSTALQSMSLGLDVTGGPDYKIHNKLPDIHRPENIVAKLDTIYESL